MSASSHWFIYVGSISCPQCGEEPTSARRESRGRWVLGWLMTGDRSRSTSNVCANGHDWENGRSAVHPPRTQVGDYLRAWNQLRRHRRTIPSPIVYVAVILFVAVTTGITVGGDWWWRLSIVAGLVVFVITITTVFGRPDRGGVRRSIADVFHPSGLTDRARQDLIADVAEIDFPVWGLTGTFTGPRWLGGIGRVDRTLRSIELGFGEPTALEGPLIRVETHTDTVYAPNERNNRRNLEYQLRADALERIDMVGMTENEIVRKMESWRRDARSGPTPQWRTVAVKLGKTRTPAKRALMGIAEATSIPVAGGFVTTLCRHTSLDNHVLELVDPTDYEPAF